jgi:hypothetical protein
MPRIVSLLAVTASLALALSACVDSSDPSARKHPPQDPPDYKGVPTDMTPPSMLEAPPRPASSPQ